MASPIRHFFDRLTGRDRIRESTRVLRATEDDMDGERIERMKALEKNARSNAANFRSASLFDAALMEKEKAEALAAQKRMLEARRGRAEDARLQVIRDDYGMGGER